MQFIDPYYVCIACPALAPALASTPSSSENTLDAKSSGLGSDDYVTVEKIGDTKVASDATIVVLSALVGGIAEADVRAKMSAYANWNTARLANAANPQVCVCVSE